MATDKTIIELDEIDEVLGTTQFHCSDNVGTDDYRAPASKIWLLFKSASDLLYDVAGAAAAVAQNLATHIGYSTTAHGGIVADNDARLTNSRTPNAHVLDSASHIVSGETPGYFLKALTATTFGFVAHGLTASDVGACASDDARLSDARTPTAHNQAATTITVTATARMLGRTTAGAGAVEELTAAQVLAFAAAIAAPATPEQGDVLYYNGSAWVSLAHGTAGQVLQSGGHGANPSWADAASGESALTTAAVGMFIANNL